MSTRPLNLTLRMGMLLWGMAAFTVVTQAQISISSTDLIEGCDDALVDSGSSTGPYGANENEFVTICPTAPDTTIWIEWNVFDLDAASTITIHDGDNTFAPILAQGSGDHAADPSVASFQGWGWYVGL